MSSLGISSTPAIQYTQQPPKSPCPLKAPGGKYQVNSQKPPVIAKFQPDMADKLTAAFTALNSQGIIPMITSGFRTPADQARMVNGASGPNPAGKVSWHEVGMAVDLNALAPNGGTSPNYGSIVNAMTSQGLTWGGPFKPTADPNHFQLAPAATKPSSSALANCVGAT